MCCAAHLNNRLSRNDTVVALERPQPAVDQICVVFTKQRSRAESLVQCDGGLPSCRRQGAGDAGRDGGRARHRPGGMPRLPSATQFWHHQSKYLFVD